MVSMAPISFIKKKKESEFRILKTLEASVHNILRETMSVCTTEGEYHVLSDIFQTSCSPPAAGSGLLFSHGPPLHLSSASLSIWLDGY